MTVLKSSAPTMLATAPGSTNAPSSADSIGRCARKRSPCKAVGWRLERWRKLPAGKARACSMRYPSIFAPVGAWLKPFRRLSRELECRRKSLPLWLRSVHVRDATERSMTASAASVENRPLVRGRSTPLVWTLQRAPRILETREHLDLCTVGIPAGLGHSRGAGGRPSGRAVGYPRAGQRWAVGWCHCQHSRAKTP